MHRVPRRSRMRTHSLSGNLNCRAVQSRQARARVTLSKREKIDAADWFSNWERGGVLLEEARHLKQWDQTLTLLWFENEEVPSPPQHVRPEQRWETEGRDVTYRREKEDKLGLKELDGQLHWPGKSRRR